MPMSYIAALCRRTGGAAKCGLFMTGLVANAVGMSGPAAADMCRFAGTTEPTGQISVRADVTARDGAIRVDVAAVYHTTTLFWIDVQYMVEEVSVWRAGRLETVGANTRYLLGGKVIRQTWDVFRRDRDALRGYRVQGKVLADFGSKFPGFVQHWDPANFGQPWLDDYQTAPPERRADLDLDSPPPSEGRLTPLAFAFYWIRWLPPGHRNVSVFLPGFKADKAVDLPIRAEDSAGGTLWQMPLRYRALNAAQASTATVRLSPDRHIQQLAMDVHALRGSGTGLLTQQGCQGTPVMPR